VGEYLMMNDWTADRARAAYLILMAEAGGHPDLEEEFVFHISEGCREFRFQGGLGFGGKFWPDEPARVTCYSEDETPERLAIIERVNDRLKGI
jgi:hypothetical protein